MADEKLAGTKETGTPANPRPVDLTAREKIYATKEFPKRSAGEEMNVAPSLAEMFVNQGWATREKPKAAAKKD